ncbi:hypothetical protein ABPG77_001267 [Micractinium sp. CCAP 211/92]
MERLFDAGMAPILTDEQGLPFVDRSPKYFEHILDFLRSGQVALPASLADLEQLLVEAEFFALDDLAERVRQKLRRCRMVVQDAAQAHARRADLVNFALPPRGPPEPDVFESDADSSARKAACMAAVAGALKAVESVQHSMRKRGLRDAALTAEEEERSAQDEVQRRVRRILEGPAERALLDIAFGLR